jgi:tRNA nucleotidyltransferase (CCA-adding enzyme)
VTTIALAAKPFLGNDPYNAIQLICSLSLYTPIFGCVEKDVRDQFSQIPRSPAHAFRTATILQYLLHPKETSSPLHAVHPSLFSAIDNDPTIKSRLFLASTLTPYIDTTYRNKKRDVPVATYVLRELLRLGSQNHFLDGIPPLFEATKLLSQPDVNDDRFQKPSQRVAIGELMHTFVRPR